MVLSVFNEKNRPIEGKIVELPSICSTIVENTLQIDPFYAKQSQFQIGQNKRKFFYNKHIHTLGQLVIQKKQTQFKPNKANNKPNSNPIQTQFTTINGANFSNEAEI